MQFENAQLIGFFTFLIGLTQDRRFICNFFSKNKKLVLTSKPFAKSGH